MTSSYAKSKPRVAWHATFAKILVLHFATGALLGVCRHSLALPLCLLSKPDSSRTKTHHAAFAVDCNTALGDISTMPVAGLQELDG